MQKKRRTKNNCSRFLGHNTLSFLKTLIYCMDLYEPRHDKTNKMSVRPVKTPISLGIRPVWSESSLCAPWVAKGASFFSCGQRRLIRVGGCPGWSESSLDAHSLCWFCHVAAHFFLQSIFTLQYLLQVFLMFLFWAVWLRQQKILMHDLGTLFSHTLNCSEKQTTHKN